MPKSKAALNSKTVKYLKDKGWHAEIVEKTIPKTHFRKDLFKCFDVLAVKDDGTCLFVQVTSKSHAADRRRKVINSGVIDAILKRNSVELHLWEKRANRWVLEREEITLDSLPFHRRYIV